MMLLQAASWWVDFDIIEFHVKPCIHLHSPIISDRRVGIFFLIFFCLSFTLSVVLRVLTEERLIWCLGTLPGIGAYWLHPQAITYIKPGSLPSLIFLDKWKSKIFNVQDIQLSCHWYFHSWVIGSEVRGLNSKLSADAMFEVARFNRCSLWREFYYASFPHRWSSFVHHLVIFVFAKVFLNKLHFSGLYSCLWLTLARFNSCRIDIILRSL